LSLKVEVAAPTAPALNVPFSFTRYTTISSWLPLAKADAPALIDAATNCPLI